MLAVRRRHREVHGSRAERRSPADVRQPRDPGRIKQDRDDREGEGTGSGAGRISLYEDPGAFRFRNSGLTSGELVHFKPLVVAVVEPSVFLLYKADQIARGGAGNALSSDVNFLGRFGSNQVSSHRLNTWI